MQATATKTVSAPVETVWAVLADHEGMSSWAPGLKATITTPGSPERNGLGAVRRLKAGPTPAIVEEITGFEPGKRLRYKALAGVPLKNYGGEVVLTPAAGGGTQIHYSVFADQRVPGLDAGAVKLLSNVLLGALVRAVAKKS